jgi:hypothetical protein
LSVLGIYDFYNFITAGFSGMAMGSGDATNQTLTAIGVRMLLCITGIPIAGICVGVQRILVAAVCMGVVFFGTGTILTVDVFCLSTGRVYHVSIGYAPAVIAIPNTGNINIVFVIGTENVTIFGICGRLVQRSLYIADIFPTTITMGMFLILTITAYNSVDVTLEAANCTFFRVRSVFLNGTDLFGMTICCVGVPHTADVVIAGIAMGMRGRQDTCTGGFEGYRIIISCIIRIYNG